MRIQRKSISVVIDVSEDADVGTSTPVELNGKLLGIISTAPDLDDTDTYTVTVLDGSSNTVYTKASLAEDITSSQYVDANNHPLQLPLSGNYTVQITASGDQAEDRTFSVELLVESYI